jgi:RNA polymerase sigma factor (sigma-70 family)
MAKAASPPILELIRRVIADPRVSCCADQELLRRFLEQHDQAAFETLLRRHGPMVLDVCRGLLPSEADVEDAFQATFLVLARKGTSIRKAASLGSWLHGVAYRAAWKARTDFARRRRYEAVAPAQAAAESSDNLTWREVRQVVHEELTALSERYRAPLVLCYLEGKTQDEAAALLGLARSTLKDRLERGRAILRARLVRRGIGPAAVLLGGAWPAATATAYLSPPLVASTVHAASLCAVGKTALGLISAKAVALTERVIQTMFLTKLKIASVVLLALILVGGGACVLILPALVAGEKIADGEAAAPRPDNEKLQGGADEKQEPKSGDARQVTQAYLAALVAGKFKDAEALAIPNMKPPSKKRAEGLHELRGKDIGLASVHVSDQGGRAIALSEAIELKKPNIDGQNKGRLYILLNKEEGGWRVREVDLRKGDSATGRVESFREHYPDAKALPK